MSGVGAFSPRVHPRPAYPPAGPVVLSAIGLVARFTAYSVAVIKATEPVYRRAYAGFAGYDIARLQRLAPWVTTDDLWFAAGLSFSVSLVYVLCNGFYGLCDRYGLCATYKMPRHRAQEPSATLVAHTLRESLIAHAVTAPLIMVFVAGPLFRGLNAGAVAPAALPSASTAAGQIAATFLVNEVWFYWGHRLLHCKVLYRNVHKQHHRYVGTRSFAAEYANPLEDVLTAYAPYLAGLLLTRAHFHVVFVWFFMRLQETYESHSGYCLRGSPLAAIGLSHWPQAAFHDHHHTVNRGCFGWILLDWLFGTMDHWVAAGGCDAYLAGKRS